jgi:hypothetical protein
VAKETRSSSTVRSGSSVGGRAAGSAPLTEA